MEPLNCTVHVNADGCEVWASTQIPTTARDVVVQDHRPAARKSEVAYHVSWAAVSDGAAATDFSGSRGSSQAIGRSGEG